MRSSAAQRCSLENIAAETAEQHTHPMRTPAAHHAEPAAITPVSETSTQIRTPCDDRPTVDEMSEWSFPASDPPATWTWDVDRPLVPARVSRRLVSTAPPT